MKRNCIFNTLFSTMRLIAVASCSDWTDVKSFRISEPAIEEQNPELYTKYLEN